MPQVACACTGASRAIKLAMMIAAARTVQPQTQGNFSIVLTLWRERLSALHSLNPTLSESGGRDRI
jgi:hypothetical protein